VHDIIKVWRYDGEGEPEDRQDWRDRMMVREEDRREAFVAWEEDRREAFVAWEEGGGVGRNLSRRGCFVMWRLQNEFF